jgi:spore coat protein CotH
MPTVSDDGSFATFSDEEAAAYAALGQPDAAYLDELITDYARCIAAHKTHPCGPGRCSV